MLLLQRPVQLHRFPLRLRRVRCFSNAAGRVEHERVTVPCRNNGSIFLDIYRPAVEPLPSIQGHANPILLYLPRGLRPQFNGFPDSSPEAEVVPDSDIATALADESVTTVVKVNYRVSSEHRFPTPIHDVLAAYDWALEHVNKNPKQVTQGNDQEEVEEREALQRRRGWREEIPERAAKQTPIGVCGEALGGTLALSLALSECRLPLSGEDRSTGRVVAASVNNPIVNWTFQSAKASKGLYKIPKRRSVRDKGAEKDEYSKNGLGDAITDVLKESRHELFHPTRPADWFDPFASPLFFLRTPGTTVTAASEASSMSAGAKEFATAIDDAEDLNAANPDDLTAQSYAELAADDTIELPPSLARRNGDESLSPSPPFESQTPAPLTLDAETARKPKAYKPRRVPLKYPPTAMLPAAFPSFRLSFAAGSELAEQGAEMATLLRRALGRFEFPASRGVSGAKDEWEDLASALGERPQADRDDLGHVEAYLRWRVGFDVKEGGRFFWGLDDAREVGRWFGEMFKRDEA